MNLICCSCGNQAPARRQWWNRDTGYGICPSCFETWVKKLGIEEAIRCCGVPGIHHSIKQPKPKLPACPVEAAIQVMKEPARRYAPDEGDWSGVWDGNQVISDADPGL